jgi:hypothetical protein
MATSLVAGYRRVEWRAQKIAMSEFADIFPPACLDLLFTSQIPTFPRQNQTGVHRERRSR